MFEVLNAIGEVVGYFFLVLLIITIIISLDLQYQYVDDTNESGVFEKSNTPPTPVRSPENIVVGEPENGGADVSELYKYFDSGKPVQCHIDEKQGSSKQEEGTPSVTIVDPFPSGVRVRAPVSEKKPRTPYL